MSKLKALIAFLKADHGPTLQQLAAAIAPLVAFILVLGSYLPAKDRSPGLARTIASLRAPQDARPQGPGPRALSSSLLESLKSEGAGVFEVPSPPSLGPLGAEPSPWLPPWLEATLDAIENDQCDDTGTTTPCR